MRNFTKILLLCFIATAGVLIFQAQDFNGHKFDDTNPNIDQPTREFYSHFQFQSDNDLDIITDASGFDNFNIGLDQAEQQVTQNPNNPLWLFLGVNNSPQNARNSTNGGLTWTLVNPSYPGGTCCDPWSAYTGTGKLIYGSGVTGQYVYMSTNNGNSWTAPVLSVSGNDRNTLAAEETGTGPFANYVYAAITPGNFARSTDEGATWTTTYSNSNTLPGVMIAVGPNGTTNGGSVVYVTNTGAQQNAVYTFQRSTDGGQTFTVTGAQAVAGFVGTLNGATRMVINNARTRPYPMIAMDNSNGPYRGRLYLVYASNDPVGDGNKPDVKLQWSSDYGATWSSWVRVHDNANPELSDQWFPAIWCDKNSGRLYIKWYDTREGPASYTTGVWATYSTDGGVTFATNQRISNATFTYPCPGCAANQNCYRGDYDGFTGNSVTGFAVWYDARGCSYQTMGAYFPDYAMKVTPVNDSLNSILDSAYYSVSVPAVKLYTRSVKFTTGISPAPGTGTISMSFVNNNSETPLDSLTTYPDSLRLKVKTSGNVTNGTYTVAIYGAGPNGTPVHQRNITLLINNVIGISVLGNEVPSSFYLYQNFPNPFNPNTNIRFDISKAGPVKLRIFDVTGKEVSELINSQYAPGKYNYDFSAGNLASGIYFYKLETPDFTSIRKMVLVK
ncbi:MAG: T9SS type A sorting domain-containing protein [Ignavibacteria bacterium]